MEFWQYFSLIDLNFTGAFWASCSGGSVRLPWTQVHIAVILLILALSQLSPSGFRINGIAPKSQASSTGEGAFCA
jgi:hypothetical protein